MTRRAESRASRAEKSQARPEESRRAPTMTAVALARPGTTIGGLEVTRTRPEAIARRAVDMAQGHIATRGGMRTRREPAGMPCNRPRFGRERSRTPQLETAPAAISVVAAGVGELAAIEGRAALGGRRAVLGGTR